MIDAQFYESCHTHYCLPFSWHALCFARRHSFPWSILGYLSRNIGTLAEMATKYQNLEKIYINFYRSRARIEAGQSFQERNRGLGLYSDKYGSHQTW